MGNIVCRACLVRCGDQRLHQLARRLLVDLEIPEDACHVIAVPGGAAYAGLATLLQTVLSLCRPEQTILTIHEDCLAGAVHQQLLDAYAMARQHTDRIRMFIFKSEGGWEEIQYPAAEEAASHV